MKLPQNLKNNYCQQCIRMHSLLSSATTSYTERWATLERDYLLDRISILRQNQKL